MDKNRPPPPPRPMFAPEPLSVRIRAWRPNGLQWGFAASLAFHALAASSLVIWAWLFGVPDFARVFQDTPLEVVLVNARSNEAPTKPQAIAQANLAGGGEAEAGIATSPLARSPRDAFGDDQSDEARTIQTQQEQQQALLTQVRHDIAAMPVLDPRKASPTPEERAQEEKRQRMIQMLAAIEKRVNAENSRPRRRYLSPSTREEVYAIYMDSLRHKIEHRGTADFPAINGRKLYGALTVNIMVNAKGQVVDTEIVHSSGQHWLDQRSLAIVRAAAPFGDFTMDMKSQTDELVLTYRFTYENDNTLRATMTSNGG